MVARARRSRSVAVRARARVPPAAAAASLRIPRRAGARASLRARIPRRLVAGLRGRDVRVAARLAVRACLAACGRLGLLRQLDGGLCRGRMVTLRRGSATSRAVPRAPRALPARAALRRRGIDRDRRPARSLMPAANRSTTRAARAMRSPAVEAPAANRLHHRGSTRRRVRRSRELACSAAALRFLTQIDVTAYNPNGTAVAAPPVRLGYGPKRRTLSRTLSRTLQPAASPREAGTQRGGTSAFMDVDGRPPAAPATAPPARSTSIISSSTSTATARSISCRRSRATTPPRAATSRSTTASPTPATATAAAAAVARSACTRPARGPPTGP